MADKKSRDTSARLRSGLVELNDRLSPLGSFPRDIASGLVAGASKGVNRMMGRAKADAGKISAALVDQPKKINPPPKRAVPLPDIAKRPGPTPPKRGIPEPMKPKRTPSEKRMIEPIEKMANGGSTSKVQTSADTARKLAIEMGGMKKGGKPKASGLAVMIAIGSPMKGMKKPVKKAMGGGMASMIPAPDGPPTGTAPSTGLASNNSNLMDMYNATRGNLIMPSGLGAASAGKEAAKARMKAAQEDRSDKRQLIKSVSRSTGGGSIGGAPISIPNRGGTGMPRIGQPMDRQDAAYQAQRSQYEQFMATQGGQPLAGRLTPQQPQVGRTSGGYNPNTGKFTPPAGGPLMPQPQPSAPMAMKKGGDAMKPVKKAQGGAGKVRKGMMTPEGKIIHAMNKIRGK